MALTGTGDQLGRLQEELDSLTGRSGAAGPQGILEALATAATITQAWTEPSAETVRQMPALPGLGAAALAAFAGGRWLASLGRRRRKPGPPPAPAPAAIPDRTARALRNRGGAADLSRPPAPGERPPITATPPGEITDLTRNFMLGAVMPIWMAAGLADWMCHRRTRIEATSGSKESVIHLLMLAEASVPVIAGMALEITSPVLLLMFSAMLLHSVTGLWDVSYAVKRRKVTPLEQHVHSYLEMVPVMATAFVSILHWPELRALLGFGRRQPDWSLRLKARPLPFWAVVTLLAGMAAFEVAPYVEELRRTRRHTG